MELAGNGDFQAFFSKNDVRFMIIQLKPKAINSFRLKRWRNYTL